MKSKFIALCLIGLGCLNTVSAQTSGSFTTVNASTSVTTPTGNITTLNSTTGNLKRVTVKNTDMFNYEIDLNYSTISFKHTESSPLALGNINYDNFGNLNFYNNGDFMRFSKYGQATFYKPVNFTNAVVFDKATPKELVINNTTDQSNYSLGLVVNTKHIYNQPIVVFQPDGQTLAFRVNGNGIVNAKLIYAEGIQVRNDAMGLQWYDHVFNADYDLMPLTEVEKFVSTNKHLPTIPTQADVNREGINLAEMDGLLLKKVEELTLYVIELNKQIEALKKN